MSKRKQNYLTVSTAMRRSIGDLRTLDQMVQDGALAGAVHFVLEQVM